MFAATQQYLEARVAALRNPDLKPLAQELSDAIHAAAPGGGSQNLKAVVSEIGPQKREGENVSIGVGNKALMGDPSDRTIDTLRMFFYKYPEFRASAWRFMSQLAKRTLAEEREAGLFGGPAYAPGTPARYYYAQSGEGTWAASAAKAGITPTNFTSRALDTWRERIPSLVAAILG